MRELSLTREQRREMQRYLFRMRELCGEQVSFEDLYIISEDRKSVEHCADPDKPCGCLDFPFGCVSGIYVYSILSNGRVLGGDVVFPGDVARYEDLVIGDLRKEKLSDIWKHSEVLDMFRNRENLKGKCGECLYKYVCGGCRRNAYMAGDAMGEDPFCWVGLEEDS